MVGSTIYIHFFLTKDLLFQVTLSEYIGKKYVILFFYPLDFTFVCPTGQFDVWKCQLKFDSCGHWISSFCFFFFSHSHGGCWIYFIPFLNHFAEITAFSDRYEEFEKLNTEILGVSIDSVVSCFLFYLFYDVYAPTLVTFIIFTFYILVFDALVIWMCLCSHGKVICLV